MRILIVDDDTTNLWLSEKMLKNIGMNLITTAENGKEAVDLCKKQDFDIIFMDIRMPILNGFEASKEIKKIKKIPTIAFTTFDLIDIEREFKYSDFDGLLQKPVNQEKFKEFFEKFKILSEKS